MTVNELKREGHRSVLRNPLLAQVFYYAGLIEKWGSGTARMAQQYLDQMLPEPEFASDANWFEVTFSKDLCVPDRLKQMGLSERQIAIITAPREKKRVRLSDLIGVLPDVSAKTIQRELQLLAERGLGRSVGLKKDSPGSMSSFDNGQL